MIKEKPTRNMEMNIFMISINTSYKNTYIFIYIFIKKNYIYFPSDKEREKKKILGVYI